MTMDIGEYLEGGAVMPPPKPKQKKIESPEKPDWKKAAANDKD